MSFKPHLKSIFLITFDQAQIENVDLVKQGSNNKFKFIEMILKFKEILSNKCLLEITYMFPLERVYEHKAVVWEIAGNSMLNIDNFNNILAKDIITVYSKEPKTE